MKFCGIIRQTNEQELNWATLKMTQAVIRLSDVDESAIATFLSSYGLLMQHAATTDSIPGSFWGDEEAGLVGNIAHVRTDTPLHSILHEACHYICMSQDRRDGLHTNAGGDYDEENAVCYLQILLADELPGFSRARMWADMDTWGYSFRLGSAQAWFEQDAEDARDWLIRYDLIDTDDKPTGRIRTT